MIRYYICMCLIFVFLSGCDNNNQFDEYQYEATPDKSAISPSGKYRLDVKLDSREYTFSIFDLIHGTEMYSYKDDRGLYQRFTTWFMWDGDNKTEDVVWCYSGDLGVFKWSMNENTEWSKYETREGEYIPNEIIKRRPTIFRKQKQ